MSATLGRRNTVVQNPKQVHAYMATMVAINRIAVVLGIMGRQIRSGIVL